MVVTRTHNGYHLGDNLVHLNFLRKVALANPDRQFVHAAQWQYLRQLQDVIADVPNIKLTDFNYFVPSDSIDVWRGRDGHWYSHPARNDFVNYHLDAWFPLVSDRMNVENPMRSPVDMLFDYPGLNPAGIDHNPFDALVINSPPGSGQWQGYRDGFALAELANSLADKGEEVIVTHRPDGMLLHKNISSTQWAKLSVTAIGNLSQYCHTILMVSTGPSWPTFNVWNQESVRHRIILLEPERVNLSPNTTHCATVDEAAEVLKGIGLL